MPTPATTESPSPHNVTRLLNAWSDGEPQALGDAMPLLMKDLRRLARSYMAKQTPGHTLQPTALVNEVYLRLVGRRTVAWENRAQFLAYVATAMRRILVNHARDKKTAKSGGDVPCVPLDEVFSGPAVSPRGVDLLDLDRALTRLAGVDPRQGRIVELRYFGGLTVEETAAILDVSPRTVKREWHTARLWLLRAL
jgi:RNA polymerase sigma factor (TIGR02999 family)